MDVFTNSRAPTPLRPLRLAIAATSLSLAASACVISSQDDLPKQDTSVAASATGAAVGTAVGTAVSTGGVPGDSAAVAASGSTTSTPDSAAALPRLATGSAAGSVVPTPTPAPALATRSTVDTGDVRLHPAKPTRGGILFAFAEQLSGRAQCQWAGKSIPCNEVSGGVLATIPLSADEPAGTYSVLFEQPAAGQGRPVTVPGKVTVADREFGREAILLDKQLYALVTQSKDVARDARAVRRIIASETAERHWKGKWRDPIAGMKGSGYGVERFYYPRADSVKVIKLDPVLRARASFGVDTFRVSDKVPSWRHAGVDIPAKKGAAVAAPQHGMVADVGDYILTGRTLLLDHGQGIYSAFFHLDSVLVRKGDVVKPGQTIGRVGSTGLSTGPHLHYGIYVHGRDVDPAAWRDVPAFALGDAPRDSAQRRKK